VKENHRPIFGGGTKTCATGDKTMQSNDYLREIKSKIANHLHWICDQSTGECADFCYGDMKGIALRGLRLSGALFAGTDLRGADFSGADLRQTVFYCADLEGASLEGADLRGADLRGACLNDAKLAHANLTGADLSSRPAEAGEAYAEIARYDRRSGRHSHVTELVDADLTSAEIQRAQLVGCDLTGALLDGARLNGADFSEAVLFGASFEEAEFGDGASAPTFSGSMLDAEAAALLRRLKIEATLMGLTPISSVELARRAAAHERWLASRGQEGRRLSMDRMAVNGEDLSGRDLTMASFNRCEMIGSDFTDTTLSLASFAYSNLHNATLARANLSAADLRKTMLRDVDFTDAVMNRAQLRGTTQGRPTNMTKARAPGAALKVAEADQVILFGADLRRALLSLKFLGAANRTGALLPEAVERRAAPPNHRASRRASAPCRRGRHGAALVRGGVGKTLRVGRAGRRRAAPPDCAAAVARRAQR